MTRSLFFLFCLFLILPPACAQVPRGDTVVVQTFTFDDIDRRTGTFSFPEHGSWEKILLVRTLKCDERTTQDQYPCGEWDYHTHTTVRVPRADSTELFELEAFITPYGKRLVMGGEAGWTWTYDVTDYAPILKGNLEVSSGNRQELLDMRFLFISGTPPRPVLSVENLYPTGDYLYRSLADDSVLQARDLVLRPDAAGYRLRARISGHGHFGPRNCCEWDAKTHTYFADDEVLSRWSVWKDCGLNAIYPQGGTWPFDRAGWCPGTPVDTYDFEITDRFTPGDTLRIDYGIEPYSDNGEAGGDFRMAHQFFTYGPPSFDTDAMLDAIIAPSSEDVHSRENPIATSPRIVLMNTGRRELRTALITYGLVGGPMSQYQWQGRLRFLERQEVQLPAPDWTGLARQNRFVVRIEAPNGTTDEYADNNSLGSIVPLPPVLPERFVVHIETNNLGRARENRYLITDSRGRVVAGRDTLADATTYDDVIQLPEGGYVFHLTDQRQDGMIRHWWNRGSNPERIGRDGRISLLSPSGEILHEFPFDFGEELRLEFFVGGLP